MNFSLTVDTPWYWMGLHDHVIFSMQPWSHLVHGVGTEQKRINATGITATSLFSLQPEQEYFDGGDYLLDMIKAVPYLYLSEGETLRCTKSGWALLLIVTKSDWLYQSDYQPDIICRDMVKLDLRNEPWIDLNSDFFVAPCAGRDAEGYRKIFFQKCAVFAEYRKTDMILIFILAVGLLISGGCNSLPYFICWKWD